MLVLSGDSHKTTRLSTQAISCYSSRLTANVSALSYTSPYPQVICMTNTPVVSSQLSTYISTKVIVSLDLEVSVKVDLRG